MTKEQNNVMTLMRENCITCIYREDQELCKTQNCSIRLAKELIEHLSADLERVTQERDAAVRDIKANKTCKFCLHYGGLRGCLRPTRNCSFKWRGVCDEKGCAEDGDSIQM